MLMILGVLVMFIVRLSLLLAAGVLAWSVYLLATHRQRRALVVLGVGSIGGLGLALFYFFLRLWFTESPVAFISEPIFVAFGSGFGWAGAGAAAIAQFVPLFSHLFSHSNRWNARRAKHRNAA
jgi:hypothetical protein